MRKLLAIPILTLTLLTPTTAQAQNQDHQPTLRPSKTIPSDLEKRCPQWHHKFREYGLPVTIFSYIAWRESRCRPNAINARFNKQGQVVWTLNRDGSIDRGLIQVNSTWKTVTSKVCKAPYGQMDVLFNVDCNLAVARYLLQNGGLGHWGM